MAAALVTCTRGEMATLLNPGNGLHVWHAVTQWFRQRSAVEQVAVMQWELTLVEHESKFTEIVPDSVKTVAMTAMLLKDILERFDGPFNSEELRIRVAACVGEKLAGQETNSVVQPMDIGQLSMQYNAVRIIDSTRSQKKKVSDDERKPFNRQAATSSPSASRQSAPRDRESGNDETKQNATRKQE